MPSAVAERTEFERTLEKVTSRVLSRHAELPSLAVTATLETIRDAVDSLPDALPDQGLGTEATIDLVLNKISQGFTQAQNGPRYFGFVVGGVTEAAQLADMLVSSYDETLAATQPEVTMSAKLESRTLEMVLDLLDIPRDAFKGRTLTTGATASNILGLACARDSLLTSHPGLPAGYSIAEHGFPSGFPPAPIVVLSVIPHGSIHKAAALTGIGRANVIEVPHPPGEPASFDLAAIETRLQHENERGAKVIVVITMGEVNTGGFGKSTKQAIELAKRYGAWVHIDGAFGGFAGLLPELRHVSEEMALADSLTLDGHKWLNVPYDCGIFYTRNAANQKRTFGPPESLGAPAYLTPAPLARTVGESEPIVPYDASTVPAPLFMGIENSRRFRALPLFASLMSLGKSGYQDLIRRNVEFARAIARSLPASYELLNGPEIPLNVVLFRGTEGSKFSTEDPGSGQRLCNAINQSRTIYVTPTMWQGKGAARLAVSNWRTGSDEREVKIVLDVLEKAMQ